MGAVGREVNQGMGCQMAQVKKEPKPNTWRRKPGGWAKLEAEGTELRGLEGWFQSDEKRVVRVGPGPHRGPGGSSPPSPNSSPL